MEKKCKVVMLATKETNYNNYLVLNKDNKLCAWDTTSMGSQITLPPQNIYITSDEEIKKGDWCYNIAKSLNSRDAIILITGDLVESANHHKFPKVIASTEDLLIPQLSTSFITKYIEEYNKGNVITEVMVEYEEYMKQGIFNKGDDTHYFDVKINPDNTINIKLIKDSWNREEIEEIIWNYKNYLNTENETVFGDTDKWIKENL